MIVLTDERIKEEICFGESLIISCGHYEGDLVYDEEQSESDWSCEESTMTVSEEEKGDHAFEVKDFVAEEAVQEEEDDAPPDFCFYFFPDCEKPPPQTNSKTSLIVVDGLPKLNPTAKRQKYCICKADKTGECVCFTKLPCKCGAKTVADCICSQLKDICVCGSGYPRTKCKCKNVDVCVCDPDGRIFPKCTCGKIEKPCICHMPAKFPSPICKCKYKPTFLSKIKTKLEEVAEEGSLIEEEEEVVEEEKVIDEQPCVCQKPDPIKLCHCLKGKDCTCLTECVCGAQRPCECAPEENESTDEKVPCKMDENKSTCSCPIPKSCTCDNTNTSVVCKCFPVQNCTCGDPENCKCFKTCECTNPCLCDTVPVIPEECVCLKPTGELEFASKCQCITESTKKLKKVRAGKEGYRWCHEINPKHTYFDYAYDRHDKINIDEPGAEKFEIQGLHNETEDVNECPVHGLKIPKYEKKPRKPSLDCCSAVGGTYLYYYFNIFTIWYLICI